MKLVFRKSTSCSTDEGEGTKAKKEPVIQVQPFRCRVIVMAALSNWGAGHIEGETYPVTVRCSTAVLSNKTFSDDVRIL